MSLKLACPRCRHVHFLADDCAGQPVTCEKCAASFRVPRLVDESLPPAVEQPQVPVTPAVPWPGHFEARELPASFAPAEPLHAKVVVLPDPPPTKRSWDHDDDVPVRAAPDARRPNRTSGDRPISRPARQTPPQSHWFAGVSGVALIIILFIGASVWFLVRDNRRMQQQQPPKVVFNGGPQFGGPRAQKFPAGGQFPQGQKIREVSRKGEKAPIEAQENENFINAKMVGGKLQEKGTIARGDPHDPLAPGCRRKVYLVELEGKRRYTFELTDPTLPVPLNPNFNRNFDLTRYDPFLRIEDSNGNIIEDNDDIQMGINLNSRIANLIIPAKGTYRIIATSFDVEQFGGYVLTIRDEDRGKPVTALPLPPRDLPQPAAVKQPMAVEKIVQNRFTVTTVLKSDEPLADNMCWSLDGNALFVMDAQGLLRRIARAGFVEEARVNVSLADVLAPPVGLPNAKQVVRNLAICRQGLLVCQPGVQEVWLLDPAKLDVIKRISAPGVKRVVAAPTLDYAFAAVSMAAKPIIKDVIMVLDTVKGLPTQTFDFSPRSAAVTPDGKFLFAESTGDVITRYRIENGELARDDDSERIGLGDQSQGIYISPDSKYVCLSCRLGNHTKAFGKEVKIYTTYVFAVDNLDAPELRVETGQAPRAFGFDPASRSVFASNHDKQFLRFSMAGVLLDDLTVPGADGPAGEPRQFLTLPDGNAVLVRTERAIYQIELPKGEK